LNGVSDLLVGALMSAPRHGDEIIGFCRRSPQMSWMTKIEVATPNSSLTNPGARAGH
jgi:hypothetical protein